MCDNNSYGIECKERCGQCSNGEQCDHRNGNCPNGCGPGFLGDKCTRGSYDWYDYEFAVFY